ncbi:hypothetical protein C0993_012362 [Termitomyces sp. T159_Od127]|nr:hypothetical protein C0993_012362 [Termitomyces sp. T159_Od127]
MDPHSRHSQFNYRVPKSGPKAINPKSIDFITHQKSPVDPKRPMPEKSDSISSLLVRRPIATNSRVKQDEKYKKDMYLSFVNNALQQKTIGETEPFDELVNQFNPNTTSSDGASQLPQLRLWLLALSHVVSRLERTHAGLVYAIVGMPWTMLDSATVKSYTDFIGMLISARPEYLSLVLEKIAQGFTYQSGLKALAACIPEGSSSPLTRRIIYDRLHYMLQHLLSLVPTLPSTLQPFLVCNFPHKRQKEITHTTYIRNLLRVSAYCPELADKILAIIVDRAIQIDVEVQVELEELDEQETGQEDLFELDPFDTVVGQEGDHTDSEDDSDDDDGDLSDISSNAEDMDDDIKTTELPPNIVHLQDMVKKLDSILTLIFDHFHRNHALITTTDLQRPPPLPDLPPVDDPSSLSLPSMPTSTLSVFPKSPSTRNPTSSNQEKPADVSPECRMSVLRTQFHTLLAIFDRTILRTFKSRYTQFLVFWYTSLDPEFSDIFQGMLVERALLATSPDGLAHINTPIVTRAAAASYIGSFVSRAVFVDREDTRRVVGVLCDFLRVHLDGVEEIMRGGGTGVEVGGMSQHTMFYAIAQAVFLIFCFRWRDLLEDKEGDDELLIGRKAEGGNRWIPQLAVLQRVVTSILNPLRVCSTNVVAQFARIAHATDFIYCYTILEANKRSDYVPNNSMVTERTRQSASLSQQQARSASTIPPSLLDEATNPELNTFFPFDPYRLPKSHTYIQGIYREWSSVALDDDDEEEEEEDDEEEEETHETRAEGLESSGLLIPRTKSSTDDFGLGKSLGAMSISPIHQPMVASVQMRDIQLGIV